MRDTLSKTKRDDGMTIKDAKLNFILGVARELLLEQSIESVTMRDIAKASGVGEATVYRYFSKKENIVIAVAETLEKEVYYDYFAKEVKGNGYEKIKAFYKRYEDIFIRRPKFFKFVREFDAYMITENRASSEEYSLGVDLFKNIFFKAYEEGIEDRSVRKLENPDAFYFSTTHALLELCKKMTIDENIVIQDETADKAAEITEMEKVILFYLASPQA